MPTTPTVVPWADTAADFARWEGVVPYMYLDTKGLVTVGVGYMLPNAAAACRLAFVRRADGQPATAAEITADYNRVLQQPKGRIAASYKPSTQLDLPAAAIDELLKVTAAKFESDLRTNFKGYDFYPVAAKRALLDMAYNLGTAGLLEFKRLKAAVEAGQWKSASLECERRGPSPARNQWTREQFLAAGAP